jgi:hypothetical protein
MGDSLIQFYRQISPILIYGNLLRRLDNKSNIIKDGKLAECIKPTKETESKFGKCCYAVILGT